MNGRKGLSNIVWNKAEHNIENARADVLLIFDCCYAGTLALPQRSPWNSRIFAFLGSTQHDGLARAPGSQSFTTALTWSLEQLAAKNPPGFTLKELEEKILSYQHFPRSEQRPSIQHRAKPSLRELRIAPLPRGLLATEPPSPANGEESGEAAYCLNFELGFLECPTPGDIDSLFEQFRVLVNDTGVPLHDVLWRGLFEKKKLKPEFSDIARRMLFQVRRKSLSSKLKLPLVHTAVVKKPLAQAEDGQSTTEVLVKGSEVTATPLQTTAQPAQTCEPPLEDCGSDGTLIQPKGFLDWGRLAFGVSQRVPLVPMISVFAAGVLTAELLGRRIFR